jgi:hypothetical protein
MKALVQREYSMNNLANPKLHKLPKLLKILLCEKLTSQESYLETVMPPGKDGIPDSGEIHLE